LVLILHLLECSQLILLQGCGTRASAALWTAGKVVWQRNYFCAELHISFSFMTMVRCHTLQ